MFDNETQVQPTSFERQQALDKALTSFGTPLVIQGQKADSIKGTPASGFTNNPTIVDEDEITDEDELVRAPGIEDEESEEEVSENDPESTDEEESALSEGFTAEFKKAFGLEPQEAIETFNQLLNFRNEIVLMQEWNVTPGEYRNRMEEVKGFYEGLPDEGKAQFNTPEGAIAIWNHLHPEGAPKQRAGVKKAGKTTKVNSKPSFLFTKSQILGMSQAEFQANAAAIQQAYANNRVNENA